MKYRHIAFLALIILSLQAFADKKMTIRNTDTGESFEVTVPDGLKIYEYNSEWLDSVPYLMERARYGEPWAYEALGDRYRYGKGGMERSMFKAIVYYELSGADVDQKAKEAITENPTDLFGLTYKLLERLEQRDNEGILSVLENMNNAGYRDANDIRDFVCDADTTHLSKTIERNIMSPDVSIDRSIFTILGCYSSNWLPESLHGKDGIVTALGEKLPYILNHSAICFFKENKYDMDSTALADKIKAIAFLEKADESAMLSWRGAEILYNHYLTESEAGRMTLDEREMERLAILARLNESEPIILTD